MGNLNIVRATSQEDKEIEDCRNLIDFLLDCFIDGRLKIFGEKWEEYKILSVKLYRLKMRKIIANSDSDKRDYFENYKVEGNYKI
jgi:hypothetical protein